MNPISLTGKVAIYLKRCAQQSPHLLRIRHEAEIENVSLVEVVGAEEVSVLRREETHARVVGPRANHAEIMHEVKHDSKFVSRIQPG